MSSPMQQFIEETLTKSFPDAQFEVRDTTGGGDHFHVDIASSRFAGMSMIQQHRLVYTELGERVGHEIHALGLSTKAI
jgi:stress-induced morphogen